jgi:hypothetical protein
VEAGFDILAREFRVRSEQLVQVWIFGQASEDMLDRNAGAAHNGLADHNLGVGYDAVTVIKLFFNHRRLPHFPYYTIDGQPVLSPLLRPQAAGGKMSNAGH